MFLERTDDNNITDLNWVNRLTVTKTVVVGESTNFVSFIEHPDSSLLLLAVTKTSLVEINNKNECTVIAGQKLPECQYLQNEVRFTKISHIAGANMQIIGKHEKTILIVDQADHCVKVFYFEEALLNEDTPIGNCGQDTFVDTGYSKIPLAEIKIPNPKLLVVDYSEISIQIIVTFKYQERHILVMNYVNNNVAFAHQYSSPASIEPITALSAIHGVVRSGRDSIIEQCWIERRVQDIIQRYTYSCSKGSQQYYIPVEVYNKLFILPTDHLELLIWPQEPVSDQVTSVRVNSPSLKSMAAIKLFAKSEFHKGGLWSYSQEASTFYRIEPYENANIAYTFTTVARNYTCKGGVLSQLSLSSVEHCAYHCTSYSFCLSFSYNINTALCTLNSDNLNAESIYQLMTTCYRII